MTELKPCPFCGGTAEVIRPLGDWLLPEERIPDGGYYGPNHYRIVCSAPWEDCGQGVGKSAPELAKAIAAWNTRTPDPEALIAAGELKPVAWRYVHLDYAGRKISRFGCHAGRVNGHDPVETHPLYDPEALLAVIGKALEAAAGVAAEYGPSRPLVLAYPEMIIRGRWEGEQAASMNIPKRILAINPAKILAGLTAETQADGEYDER